MNTTFSITFYCRQSNASKKTGLAPIEVSVCINGNRWLLSLPRKAKPKEFAKAMKNNQQTPIRDYTSAVSAKIEDFQTKCLREGKPFTKESLKEFIYFGFTDDHYTMGFLFDAFLSSQMKKVEGGLSTARNYRKYEIVRDNLYNHSNILATTHLQAIRQKDIIDFNSYLLSVYDSTTVAGMMQKLKSVFIYGINNRIMKDNPFLGFKIPRKQKDVQHLTQEEVRKIRIASMPTPRLEIYRDLFLFQCYTALSFVDMENLAPSDFQRSELGYIYVEKPRAKTGVVFCAILFEDAINIAKKYDYQLPTTHIQNYNSGLRVIADICGITKPMHSHIGRHTAACYLLNEKHLPFDIVARILGHATTKLTRHYAKLLDKTIFESIHREEKSQLPMEHEKQIGK